MGGAYARLPLHSRSEQKGGRYFEENTLRKAWKHKKLGSIRKTEQRLETGNQ
jgi:hypothetical protein